MAWTRARRRWVWALALVLAAVAVAVPLTVARRDEPTPRGTLHNVLLKDFEVRQEATAVPAGTVSFRIRNQGPTTHELIVVRTDLTPDKLPLQDDGLTVDEEGRGIKLLEEVEGSTSTTARPWSWTWRQATTSCTATWRATTWGDV